MSALCTYSTHIHTIRTVSSLASATVTFGHRLSFSSHIGCDMDELALPASAVINKCVKACRVMRMNVSTDIRLPDCAPTIYCDQQRCQTGIPHCCDSLHPLCAR